MLDFTSVPIDTADMRPLYFVPDADSPLLSDLSRDGSIYFSTGPPLPEDIHWRSLCNRACRLLGEGRESDAVLKGLCPGAEEELSLRFRRYTGMSPEAYARWRRERQDKI